MGPVHAEADVKADATVDLKEGKVSADAKANAKVGVDGVAEVTTKVSSRSFFMLPARPVFPLMLTAPA